MDLPSATRADVEDGVSIDIVARVLDYTTFPEGDTRANIEDLEGNRLECKIWEGDADPDVLEEGEWFLFETAKGDRFRDEILVESNFGNLEITPIDPPESIATESSHGEGATADQGGVLAFDIETISTVPEGEFDFRSSDHVELLSIGVGYSATGDPPVETEVLLRSGTSPADEADLIEEFCEYVEERDPATLLLYKGIEFDRRHLIGRAERAGGEDTESRIRNLFERYEVTNLDPYGSLESNVDVVPTYWDVYDHSLDPAVWRSTHPNWDEGTPVDSPVVQNTDIPYFGERLLELADEVDDVGDPRQAVAECRALRELIVHYTRADIEPLFELSAPGN